MFADTASSSRWPDTGSRTRAIDRADRDVILAVYLLYAIGFFTGITALAGVALAHHRRARTRDAMARAQLSWQIRLFWMGALAWVAIGIAHGAVAAFGAITGGLGLVFMIVPWSMIALWSLLTIWAMARGLVALYRGRPVA